MVAEKYGSGTSPVRSRIRSGSSSRQRAAVRRSCQTIAGATGRPVTRSHSNVVSRWFVIAIVSTPSSPASPAATRTRLPDLLGIVLDPARPRKVLRQLGVTATVNMQFLVDHEAGRAGRALVDREDHESCEMNASVRPQASSDASA